MALFLRPRVIDNQIEKPKNKNLPLSFEVTLRHEQHTKPLPVVEQSLRLVHRTKL